MGKLAADFDKIIQEGRERKRNEALAQRIFSSDRKQSQSPKLKPGTGPSLASRVGVKKRVPSTGPRPNVPAGNVNGEWTHDLHDTVNDRGARGGGLAARVSGPRTRRSTQRSAQVASALDRTATSQKSTAPVAADNQARSHGLSIRGLAGPFAVMAQNFAPGTTAADIESAMTPVGGEMVSCAILKTSPLVVAEMVFVSKEGADQVISTFNNQVADGRVIKVYAKPGGYKAPAAVTQPSQPISTAPTGPRGSRQTSSQVLDGSHGFSEPLTADFQDAPASRPSGALYSDTLVGNNRRARGSQRGRAGR